MLLRKKKQKTDALFFPSVSSGSTHSVLSHLSPRVRFLMFWSLCLHIALFQPSGFRYHLQDPPTSLYFVRFFFPSFIQYLGGSRFSAVRFRLGTLETRLGGVWTCCWFLTVNCDINSTFIYWRCIIKNVSRGGSCLFFFCHPSLLSCFCHHAKGFNPDCPGGKLNNLEILYINM